MNGQNTGVRRKKNADCLQQKHWLPPFLVTFTIKRTNWFSGGWVKKIIVLIRVITSIEQVL